MNRILPRRSDIYAIPANVAALLAAVAAPPRLVAHLRLVHDAACDLTAALTAAFPGLTFDRDAVLFGAATHDIGKALHVSELSAPGSAHELAGYQLLLDHGVAPKLAHFARTHGAWQSASTVEELLVILADKVWKAKRVEDLEQLIVDRIAATTGQSPWEIFMALDHILTHIAASADERLAYQSAHPI